MLFLRRDDFFSHTYIMILGSITDLQRSDDGKGWILDTCKLLKSRATRFFASNEWSFIYCLEL